MRLLTCLLLLGCAHPTPAHPVLTIDPPEADVTETNRRGFVLLVEHALRRNDPPPGCTSWSACVPEAVRVAARLETANGAAVYLRGDFRGAYQRFKTAYLATHDPALLANMAFALSHFDRWSAFWFLLEYLNEAEINTEEDLAARVTMISLLTRLRDASDWETALLQREPEYPIYPVAFIGPLPEGALRGVKP
jgi:hypothetical protein